MVLRNSCISLSLLLLQVINQISLKISIKTNFVTTKYIFRSEQRLIKLKRVLRPTEGSDSGTVSIREEFEPPATIVDGNKSEQDNSLSGKRASIFLFPINLKNLAFTNQVLYLKEF